MNERVPDSSGLPLRAMVMVLLFLGVIFLLVGFQAISGGNSGEDESVNTVTTITTTPPTSTAPAAVRPIVRVYNISGEDGVAGRTADELKANGWDVTEVGNLSLPEVTATTVYFGETAGEREAADAVGELLEAPVEPRVPEVAEQPPGIIVVVTG